jgi:hypothetical protein
VPPFNGERRIRTEQSSVRALAAAFPSIDQLQGRFLLPPLQVLHDLIKIMVMLPCVSVPIPPDFSQYLIFCHRPTYMRCSTGVSPRANSGWAGLPDS